MKTDLEVLTDTIRHISEVSENLAQIRHDLERRGLTHDRSKLESFEFDAFVSTRPLFRKANYGTKEYQECTEAIKPAIDHHYANNRHHTAFHPNGFADMNLLDILEMLADMQQHILNTLQYLGWLE